MINQAGIIVSAVIAGFGAGFGIALCAKPVLKNKKSNAPVGKADDDQSGRESEYTDPGIGKQFFPDSSAG